MRVKSLNRLKARFQAAKPDNAPNSVFCFPICIARTVTQNKLKISTEHLSESQEDARAVLALALLRVDQGQAKAVRDLLSEAERRRVGVGQDDLKIQALAAAWGVAAAQIRAGQAEPRSTDLR